MGEQDDGVISVEITDEGRVLITMAADPPAVATASPKAARDLAKELVAKAKSAEQQASIPFRIVRRAAAPSAGGAPAAGSQPSKPRSGKGSRLQALSLLVESGHLHVGERLRVVYPANAPGVEPAWLTVTDASRLGADEGDDYNNPSKAVKALFSAAPATVNGWGVVKAHRDGAAVSLSEIKKDEASGAAPRQRTEWPSTEVGGGGGRRGPTVHGVSDPAAVPLEPKVS